MFLKNNGTFFSLKRIINIDNVNNVTIVKELSMNDKYMEGYQHQDHLKNLNPPSVVDYEWYWFTTIASGIGKLKMSEEQALDSLATLEPADEVHD